MDTGGQRPRGSIRLLLDVSFGLYIVGKFFATIATWIYNIVAAIIVYNISSSALLVGLVSVFQFAPQLLFAPWAGALADRRDRRRLLIVGRLMVSCGAGGLGLVIGICGLNELPGGVRSVLLSALVVGVGFALSVPAMLALVPALVRRNELMVAVALDALPFTTARALGPALGAALFAVVGPAYAFGVAALGTIVFVCIVAVIPLRPTLRANAGTGSVLEGLRHVKSDPKLFWSLIAVAGMGYGVDPVITLTPVIADTLGGTEALVGQIASAFGAGAAVSILFVGLLLRRIGTSRLSSTGLLVFSIGMSGLGVSASPSSAIVSMITSGLGFMLAVTGLTSQIQDRVSEDVRGRIMALWAVAFIGSRPVAALVNGAIADHWSVRAALASTVVVLLVSAASAELARRSR